MSRSSATASPSTRARSASRLGGLLVALPRRAQHRGIVDAGPSAGDDPQLARRGQHRLVADRRLQLSGAAEQFRLRGQRRDGAGPAGRRVHLAADRQRVADGLAGVDVEAGRRALLRQRRTRRTLTRRTPSSSSAPAIASTWEATETGKPERLGEHRTDRGVRPAQPGVVEVAGGAVDDTAGGNSDPQRARGGASGSGSDGRCRPARPARVSACRAASASRRRRACGRTGRWPRCSSSGRRCGCRGSGTARG